MLKQHERRQKKYQWSSQIETHHSYSEEGRVRRLHAALIQSATVPLERSAAMAPSEVVPALDLDVDLIDQRNDPLVKVKDEVSQDKQPVDYNQDMKWHNVFAILALHLVAIYAVIVCLPAMSFASFCFTMAYGSATAMGITAGVHRFWSHRSYKANVPLRIILMICFAATGQNKLYAWVRDHRVHHKFSETPADPHNASRGMFFAHMGWLMKKKHPSCLANGKKIDMSDIENDPVVQFFDNNYIVMKALFAFILPTMAYRYLCGETWLISFLLNTLKYTLVLNLTWGINSFAHTFGSHPYDKNIGPTNSLTTAILTYGEGWHNFHHTFPWDYRSAETGIGKDRLNMTANFIDFFASIGWAYDLKLASKDLIMRQAQKKGDGTRFVGGHAVAEAHNEE